MIVNPGIRRFLGSAIQRLFNSASVSLPLTHSLIPTRGSITPSFTRATTEIGQKWDEAGYLDFTALAGEMVFKGARRVRNWIQAPTENWSSAGWVKSGISVSGNRLTATGANGVIYDNAALGMGTGRTAVGSVTLSRVTGTGNIDISTNGGITWTTVSVTGARVSVSLTGNINGQFVIRIVTSGDAVDATYPQLEDVTGQTAQTASEYVSVGVESAPAYHGSMVDGVKCYDTDRSGNPISTSGSYPLVGYVPWEARTNLVWPSEDLTSVRYVSGGGGIAVVADQAVAPDGTTTADQLTASGANGTLIQDLGVIASTAQCFSLHLKRKTGTGNIDITLDGGATWTTQTINSTTWTRCEKTQTLANPDVGIRIVTSGDAVYAWGLQCE